MEGSELTSSTVSDGVLSFSLPVPTNPPIDTSKKSHARKQPEGHIPRPRNAFILFRSDVVRQKKVPVEVEKDHRNISRIAGKIWTQMSDEQKAPWVEMAEKDKAVNYQRRQGNRFAPFGGASGGKQKPKRGEESPQKVEIANSSQWTSDYFHANGSFFSRSSSCPPGAEHIPQSTLENCLGYGAPIMTRDDLSRRPSRVTLYQSTDYLKEADPPKSDAPPKLFQGPSLFSIPYFDIQPVHIPGLGQLAYEHRPWDTWKNQDDVNESLSSEDASGSLEDFPHFTNPFAYSSLPPMPRFSRLASPHDIPVSDVTENMAHIYAMSPPSNGPNLFPVAPHRK